MKKYLIVSLFLLLSILLSTCSTEPYDGEKTFEQVTSKILITPTQNLPASSGELILNCETEISYPCMNYSIDFLSEKSENTIEINFRGIVKPLICATAFGPARNSVNLGILSNGNYQLNVKVNGVLFSTKLIVDDESFKFEKNAGKWITIHKEKLFKVPQNIIWGTIGYHSDSLETYTDNFLDSLELSGAENVNLTPGDYGYFEIDEKGEMVKPVNHGYHFIKTFVYRYTENINNLVPLLKSSNNNSPTYYDPYIKINDYKGNKIYSWIY